MKTIKLKYMSDKSIHRLINYFFAIVFVLLAVFKSHASDLSGHHIGEILRSYNFSQEVGDIVGMAFQESEGGSFFYLFEGKSGKFHRFQLNEESGELTQVSQFTIDVEFVNPRGLEYALEASNDILYFFDHEIFMVDGVYKQKGVLYRYDLTNDDLTNISLNEDSYNIGTSQLYSVAKQDGNLFLSFDPSTNSSYTAMVRRGLAVLSINNNELVEVEKNGKTFNRPAGWQQALSGNPSVIRQMPGPGKKISSTKVEVSQALTAMTIDDNDYLWGTVGGKYIYLIDSKTGRGISFFENPVSITDFFFDVITYGKGFLWVAGESIDGTFSLNQVNVTGNLDLPFYGPKRFRELRMKLTSTVNENVSTPQGYVYHTFCHPYSGSITKNQGAVPESVRVVDLTGVSDYTVENLYYNPAGDTANRQNYTLVSYLTDNNPSIRQYKTEFYIKFWARSYKQFIYPHLTIKDPLSGTRYLEDDEILYAFDSDPGAYHDFIARVTEAIKNEYKVEPDMENPYWAARSIVEYIVENYHYPIDEDGYYATYDFENGDYNSHPGNKKVAYSADSDFNDNIIGCSGSGSMVAGVLRYIGFPSSWIGTGSEGSLSDGFLNSSTEVSVSNGHRWNKIWLGELYGWQDIDATPKTPSGITFYSKPKELSQWDIMQKACAEVDDHRIIFNVQSEFWDKLYVPCRSTVSNVNQYGSQRYNLLGSYTNPEYFDRSSQSINTRGIQFINNVNVAVGDNSNATVTWQKDGDWDLDTDAKFMLILEKVCLPNESCFPGVRQVAVLTTEIPGTEESFNVNLSEYDEGTYRMVVAKVNDPVIGNVKTFKLEHNYNSTDLNYAQGREVKIYPNPTKGVIYIEAERIRKVEILNSDGRLVSVKNSGDLHYIDLSNRIDGLYIVKVFTDKTISANKILLTGEYK